MELSQVIVCVLFILACFGVGESLFEKIALNKISILIILAIWVVASFFPPISFSNFSFTIDGFVLPLILSFYFLFKVKSSFGFLRIGVSILFVATLSLLYNIFAWENYQFQLLQPYLLLSVVIGLVVFLITKMPNNTFIALFLGLSVSELILHANKSKALGYQNYFIGGEQTLCFLFVSLIVSMFALYFSRKIKLIKRRNARRKAQQ